MSEREAADDPSTPAFKFVDPRERELPEWARVLLRNLRGLCQELRQELTTLQKPGALLLSADVARALGITPATVREAAVSERLRPWTVTPGGTRIFAASAVEAFRLERADRKHKENR
jgi:hypothetical protein